MRADTVGSLSRAAAEQAPSMMALVEGLPEPADRQRWRYAELLDESEQMARALLGRFAPDEEELFGFVRLRLAPHKHRGSGGSSTTFH